MWTVQRQERKKPKKQLTTLHFDMLVLKFDSLPEYLTYFFWVGQDFSWGKRETTLLYLFFKELNFSFLENHFTDITILDPYISPSSVALILREFFLSLYYYILTLPLPSTKHYLVLLQEALLPPEPLYSAILLNYIKLSCCKGFAGSSAIKNLPVNTGNSGSVPGLGRCPGERNGNPL